MGNGGHGHFGSRSDLSDIIYNGDHPKFGQLVSEEKIKMWKINRHRTQPDTKRSLGLWLGEQKINDYEKKV